MNACGKLPTCCPVGRSPPSEAEVVGVGEHLRERHPRVVEAAGTSEHVDVEEVRDGRCPPTPGGRPVTPAGRTDTPGCRRPASGPSPPSSTANAGRFGTMKPISGMCASAASSTSPPSYWTNHQLLVPALGHDLGVDAVPLRPSGPRRGTAPARRHADARSSTTQDIAARTRSGAGRPRLPDALVGVVPVLAEPVDHGDDVLPALVSDAPVTSAPLSRAWIEFIASP